MQRVPGRDPFDDRIRLALIAGTRRARPARRVWQLIARRCAAQDSARGRRRLSVPSAARAALRTLRNLILIEPACPQSVCAAPMPNIISWPPM
jgi:hypothetical protein